MGDDLLCAEIVVEGESFNKLLDARTHLALVSPGIDTRDFGNYGGEENVDLVEAGLIFRDDFRWEGLIGGAHALKGEDAVVSD